MIPSDPFPARNSANRRVLLACAAVVVSMAGAAYAAVPLYDLFCKVTGYGGTPRIARQGAGTTLERAVTVRFDSNVAPGLSWRFDPEVASVEAKLGETMTVFYKVTNTGPSATTGIASFNVVPELAGGYFNKLQCFCFNEITLKPGESMEAPVVFFIDPALATERDVKGISTITLSYTFFAAKGSPKPMADAKDSRTPKL